MDAHPSKAVPTIAALKWKASCRSLLISNFGFSYYRVSDLYESTIFPVGERLAGS